MKGGVLAALGALGAFLLFRGARNTNDMINQLQINLSSLSFNRQKSAQALFLNIFFDVRLTLFNPTPGKITIKHIYIEIFANGQPLGGVTKPDTFSINSNVKSDINFTARILTGTAINQIISAFNSSEAPELSAVGYIDTNLGRIPFKKEF